MSSILLPRLLPQGISEIIITQKFNQNALTIVKVDVFLSKVNFQMTCYYNVSSFI